MSESKMLLSCPFCGAPAEYDSQRWRPPTRSQFTSATGHAITCSACEAEVGLFECFEDAATAWNRRASLAAVTRERDALAEQRDTAMAALREIVDLVDSYGSDYYHFTTRALALASAALATMAPVQPPTQFKKYFDVQPPGDDPKD